MIKWPALGSTYLYLYLSYLNIGHFHKYHILCFFFYLKLLSKSTKSKNPTKFSKRLSKPFKVWWYIKKSFIINLLYFYFALLYLWSCITNGSRRMSCFFLSFELDLILQMIASSELHHFITIFCFTSTNVTPNHVIQTEVARHVLITFL